MNYCEPNPSYSHQDPQQGHQTQPEAGLATRVETPIETCSATTSPENVNSGLGAVIASAIVMVLLAVLVAGALSLISDVCRETALEIAGTSDDVLLFDSDSTSVYYGETIEG